MRLDPLGFVGHQQGRQHEHECGRYEERGALEEEKRVKIEQRAQQEVDKGGAILVVPTLRGGHRPDIAGRFPFGEEQLHQDHGDEQQIHRLLDDRRPGVDAIEQGDVEHESADERGYVEGMLVAFVVEPEPMEPGG